MQFLKAFDEEINRAAAEGCVNDGAALGAPTYALSLTTTSANLSDVKSGIYHAFLAGMDPTATVLINVDRSSNALPTPTAASPEVLAMFPGSVVVRLRVMPGMRVVSARLISGSGDLYLVPVVGM